MKIIYFTLLLQLAVLLFGLENASAGPNFNSRRGLNLNNDSAQSFEYGAYAKGVSPVCQPTDPIRVPNTKSEVVAIVHEAIRRKTTVKAFGQLHSSTDIICTSGIPVDMNRIEGIKLNSDSTVTAGAGVSLRQIADFLLPKGLALRNLPAYGNITIGGSVATGAHGSSLKHHSSISEYVVELLIVDGLGKVRRIREEADLRAFRVNLGLLGIILEVTLRTVPIYKVQAHNYILSDEVLLTGEALKLVKEADHMSIYWFPSFQKVIVAQYTNVDVSTPGDAVTNDHIPSTTQSFHAYATRFLELAQSRSSIDFLNFLQAYTFETLHRTVPDFPPIYSDNGITVTNPAVGYYHKMLSPICQDQGWDQCAWLHGNNSLVFLDHEMGVELERLPDVVRTVKDILSKHPAVFPFQGILLRFSPSSESYMSLSRNRNTCNFEFYTSLRKNYYEHASLGIGAYQAIMQSLARNFSGRAHWGKNGAYYHSKEILRLKLEPDARNAFIQKMVEFDPNGVFLNNFGNRLLGKSNRNNIDPRVTHCALLDNCLCSKQTDCAKGQNCSTINGYPEFPVCKSRTADEPLNPYNSIVKFFVKLLRDHARKLFSPISNKDITH